MNAIAAFNALVALLLAIAWNRDDVLNVFLKLFFWFLFVVNFIAVLKLSGYIVKVGQ